MKILVEGQLIEYKDEGKGPIIVLLHGWGTNLGTFDDLAAHLITEFRVIRLDFPGFGGSANPLDSWHVGDYATFVSNFLTKIKATEVYTLIGHSFGGRVIIKGISSGKLQSKKVVLIGSAGIKPPQSAKKILFKGIAKAGKAVTAFPGLKSLRPALRKRLYGAVGSTDYLNAHDLQQIFVNTINEDLLADVHAIKIPTLLIWGENDSETPVSDAHSMEKELPHSQLAVIPEAGHFVYIDDKSAVIKELDAFL